VNAVDGLPRLGLGVRRSTLTDATEARGFSHDVDSGRAPGGGWAAGGVGSWGTIRRGVARLAKRLADSREKGEHGRADRRRSRSVAARGDPPRTLFGQSFLWPDPRHEAAESGVAGRRHLA